MRGQSEEVRVLRNGLKWVARLSPRAIVMSRSSLLPRTISSSVALMQQWWFMFIIMVPITIKGLLDSWSLKHHLRPCQCTRDVSQEGPCQSKRLVLSPRIMVMSGLRVLSRVISGSIV